MHVRAQLPVKSKAIWKICVYTNIYVYIYIFVYMKVAQNSFLSDRPFLAKKVFTLAKLSPFPQKLSRGPILDYKWECLDICASERPSKTHSVAAAHSHVVFAFHVGPCSPSPDSSDTSTPKLRAHLSPVSLETRITSQQFRPPSSQEKAVFRQTFAKITLYKLKYNLYLYLQKSIYVPVISYYFRETFAKK